MNALDFFADLSLITVPYCRENAYFYQLIFTLPSCRECRGFFVFNYWLVCWANSHGTLLPWVPSFFYFWLKSYNSAVLAWKNILFSANFHCTQLPRVPWIFWLKLLTSQVGQFSQHLAAVDAVVFLCWLKSYNCAILPWKNILFSDSFHGTQLPWVPWIFY